MGRCSKAGAAGSGVTAKTGGVGDGKGKSAKRERGIARGKAGADSEFRDVASRASQNQLWWEILFGLFGRAVILDQGAWGICVVISGERWIVEASLMGQKWAMAASLVPKRRIL